MNACDRVRAALEGRRPDAVPVMLHNFMVAAEEAGYTQARFREDPAVIVEAFRRAVERYAYDGILLDIDTTILAGAAGVPIAFPQLEPAIAAGHLLERIADVGGLRPVRVESYRYVQVLLEAARRLAQTFRGSTYVRANCDQDPFSLATMIRGSAELMMDLCDPGALSAVEELLEYCTDVSCQMVRLVAQTGCDMLSNGDSPAGPDLISPQMYARFAQPYERRVVELARSLGLPYALHICGDTSRILEDMVRTGADCLELDFQTDPAIARRVLDGRATFIGNIDPSGILHRGTVEQVETATRSLLEVFADTPRFILNAGCALPRGTPRENIHAMIRTARQWSAAGGERPGAAGR